MSKILIVEDEESIADLEKDILNGTFERKSIFVCVFKEIVPGFE